MAPSATASQIAELVEDCDREIFSLAGDIDEVVSRAAAIAEWGRDRGSAPAECRGLIRLVFAEIRWGRWRNDWEPAYESATRLAEQLPRDSIEMAEFTLFDGYLKALYFDQFELGIERVRHAIAIAESHSDIHFLAEAHFLLGEALAFQADELDVFESLTRSIVLAKQVDRPALEHLSMNFLILNAQSARRDPPANLPRYEELCERLGQPLVMTAASHRMVAHFERVVAETRHSIEMGISPLAQEIGDDSRLMPRLVQLRRQLGRATAYLVEFYGLVLRDWEKADPHIAMLERVAAIQRDNLTMGVARHFRALSLASKRDIEGSRAAAEPLIADLEKAGDHRRLTSVHSSLAEQFAEVGETDESLRHLRLASTHRALREQKLTSIADASAQRYRDLLVAEGESRRAAAAVRQSRYVSTLVGVAALVLGVCLWMWRRSIDNRAMQHQLRAQLDLKTKSLKLATQRATAADRAKTEYLARINHELRNPLGAIVNSCELLAEGVDDLTAQSARKTIDASASVLLDVINEVLDFTRIEIGKLDFKATVFSPRELLTSVASITESVLREGVVLRVEVDPQTPAQVFTDEPKLRQMALNLCGNAAKYTERGSVRLGCRYKPSREAGEEGWLVVEVEDTGPGIDAEVQEHLFERYSQSGAHSGRGLGLYICKAFVECLGGTITCASQAGVGTKMTIAVPAARRDAKTERDPEKPAQAFSGVRVLVIEDSHDNLVSLAALLTAHGFDVSTASGWRGAESLLAVEHFPVVLTDLRMPEVDGYELAKRIQTQAGPIPKTIAMTGDATTATRTRAMNAGFDGYVTKPFTAAELLATIRGVLNSEPNASAGRASDAVSTSP